MIARSALVGPLALLALALAPDAPIDAQAPRGERRAIATLAADAEARRVFEQAVEAQVAAEMGGREDAGRLLQAAIAGYRRVLELRPNAVAALYNLGRLIRAQGDSELARTLFARAASRPGRERVFYLEQWADFLRDEGRLDDALRAYEEVVLLEPRLDAPHELLRRRYLELAGRDPDRLLEYLWRLVEGRQAARAADLALDALEAGVRPRYELIAAFVAGLAQLHGSPEEILDSPALRRVRRFTKEPGLGEGVSELLRLYASAGLYTGPFRWWDEPFDTWTERRGLSRREAFRAALRAIGDDSRARQLPEVAAACYRAAVDLGDDPDPVALRRLASVYVERNDLPALDRLAAEYADPAGRVFEAKNRAYALGQLDKVLDFHRALAQIYGSLARSGRTSWGSIGQPATALYQLDRTFKVALRLDAESTGSGEQATTKIDPDLTILYAQGLEATGSPERAWEVRIEASRRFEEVGDLWTSSKVANRGEKMLAEPLGSGQFEHRDDRAAERAAEPDDRAADRAAEPDAIEPADVPDRDPGKK